MKSRRTRLAFKDRFTLYYYSKLNQILTFLVPQNKKVLYFGRVIPGVIPQIVPSNCHFVHKEQYPDIEAVQENYTKFSSLEEFVPDDKYDFIILNETIGETKNICHLLKNIRNACHQHTRIVIIQHNYLWEKPLILAGKLGIINDIKTQNWISIRELNSYLNSMGFEHIRSFRNMIFPVKLGFIGPLINLFVELLPFFDFFKLSQFLIVRPIFDVLPKDEERPESLTICITVRDEKENIQPIVDLMPRFCEKQEILFVEGHSKDGTREEIKRVSELYPEKNVRLIIQPGIGQGDATQVGFKDAKGEIIIIYEGDGTAEPEDVRYFYEALQSGRFEFVEGCRFVYPLHHEAMPFFNKIGNAFFAKWFSWFLGQDITDVLCGIKGIRKRDFETIYDHWGFLGVEDPFGDFELLFGAMRFGLKTGQIPTQYKPRTYGESKTRVFHHGLILLKMAYSGYRVFRSFNHSK